MAPNEYLPFRYRGDGDFIDHGAFYGGDRYQWDFGNIDEFGETEKEFEIGNLPGTLLSVSLVTPIGIEGIKSRSHLDESVIDLSLIDNKTGESIFAIGGPLSQWDLGRQTSQSSFVGSSLIDSSCCGTDFFVKKGL